MNFDTYTIMCGISVHAIAEVERLFEEANTCICKPQYFL